MRNYYHLTPERVLIRASVSSYIKLTEHISSASNDQAFSNCRCLIQSFIRYYNVNPRYWRLVALMEKLESRQVAFNTRRDNVATRKNGNDNDVANWIKRVIDSSKTKEQLEVGERLYKLFAKKREIKNNDNPFYCWYYDTVVYSIETALRTKDKQFA